MLSPGADLNEALPVGGVQDRMVFSGRQRAPTLDSAVRENPATVRIADADLQEAQGIAIHIRGHRGLSGSVAPPTLHRCRRFEQAVFGYQLAGVGATGGDLGSGSGTRGSRALAAPVLPETDNRVVLAQRHGKPESRFDLEEFAHRGRAGLRVIGPAGQGGIGAHATSVRRTDSQLRVGDRDWRSGLVVRRGPPTTRGSARGQSASEVIRCRNLDKALGRRRLDHRRAFSPAEDAPVIENSAAVLVPQ